MILHGSQRAGAAQLSAHLLNDRDNDHIELAELRGFMADDLHGALQEAHAISQGTRCKQYLFSLSLSPPPDHTGTAAEFRAAIENAEEKLGLKDQPRAVVIHEKEGRRHAHVVWSRIDAEAMKAINLPHFKRKLTDLSRDLYLEHGWRLPNGLARDGGKNPMNFTLAEWQQAKRLGRDAREIKQIFVDAWARSDNAKALGTALEERGFFLAKGDRRGVVALDTEGNVYSLSRWSGAKSKEIKARIEAQSLPSVADRQREIRREINSQLRSYIGQVKDRQDADRDPLRRERRTMVDTHRLERQRQKDGQALRWDAEAAERSKRLNGGLRGLFDRLTGRASAIQAANEKESWQALKRDQAERDDLVLKQMQERQDLQRRMDALRERQIEDRKVLARDIRDAMRRISRLKEPTGRSPPNELDQTRERRKRSGPDLSL